MSGWVCPNCGACWSDLFIGPCPHPRVTTAAAHTGDRCNHTWEQQTVGLRCRRCHNWLSNTYPPDSECGSGGEGL